MKNLLLFTVLIVCLLSVSCFQKDEHKLSTDSSDSLDGWFKAGSKPGFYTVARSEEKYNGENIYYIQSTEDVINGFGTIMKMIEPGEYSGKRVRLTGNIKTQRVDNYTGMWMRVDGKTPGVMLGFDNMQKRPIEGTTEWQKYEIVLDVPDSSAAIAYGVLMNGNGTVWLSGLTLEVVGEDVAVTNMLESTVQVQVNEPDTLLPAELRNVPDGFEVTHTPQTVYATRSKDDTVNYYWIYKTTVKALNEDLEITEFGSYSWIIDHWEFGNVTGKPFEPKDFSEWYECKNGRLKKGKQYSDKNNWNRSPLLNDSKSLWYYIGKNKQGKLFKGAAIVESKGELKK